jgi:hypothetical protein
MHGVILGVVVARANAILQEKGVVIWEPLATFPARERSKRFADLHTWSRTAEPNQRMRSRRSLTKRTIR